MVAIPCPAPMHMVARPKRALRSCMAWIKVVAMRAPLAPNGWPIAIAPPRILTFSGSSFKSLMTARVWAAKASLISIRSISSSLRPARSRALCVAGIGRLSGTPMAAEGEFVLLPPTDFVLESQVFCGNTHIESCRTVVIEKARARIEACFHRDVVHVLDAAGNLDVFALGGYALGGLVDGLKTRAAVASHRYPNDSTR